jgi:hypothetical protein
VVGPNTTLDRQYSAQGNRAAAAPTQQHGARRGKHAWRGLSSHGDRPITYRQTPLNAGTRWAPEVSCGEMKGKRTAKAGAVAAAQEGAKKVAVAAAQEGAKEVAVAGAAYGAEASGLLGFWVWGRCLFRFSTAAGLSVVLRCIGIWFCRTIYIWHSCVLVTCWLGLLPLVCAPTSAVVSVIFRLYVAFGHPAWASVATLCALHFRFPTVLTRPARLCALHFSVPTFLTRRTRSPRRPRRGNVATRFFFPDAASS